LLTDRQIDRYSRQIILPEMGGIGQERLLAARLTILAEIEDLTPALDYLTGGGVGNIDLDCPQDAGQLAEIISAMAELNPEVKVQPVDPRREADSPLIVLAGSNAIIEAARSINRDAKYPFVIFARLGEPYQVAVLHHRPPCLRCAKDTLLGPVERGSFAPAVAMMAAAETIKALLAVAPGPSRLIECSGYESRSTILEHRETCPICE
jgi:adenylyltransferase/sulfurtransferase